MKKLYDNPQQREKHKAFILTKTKCECGTETSRCNMSRHRKTSKHQNFIKKREKLKAKQTDTDARIDELQRQINTLKASILNLIAKQVFTPL